VVQVGIEMSFLVCSCVWKVKTNKLDILESLCHLPIGSVHEHDTPGNTMIVMFFQ
jgi:nitrate reductase NapAB chaperone NapD